MQNSTQNLSPIQRKKSCYTSIIQKSNSETSLQSQNSEVFSQKINFDIDQSKNENFESFKSKRSQMRKRLSLSIPHVVKSIKNIQYGDTTSSAKQLQKSQKTSIKISTSNFLQQFFNDLDQEDSFILNEENVENFEQKYQLMNKLGQGAHSSVYKCKNKISQKYFAVKISQNIDEEMKDIMIKQYKLSKILEHDHVLKVFELIYNQKEQNFFIIYELCQYLDLRQEISIRKKLNKQFLEKQTILIIKEILKAVKYIHASGVCHRDLKPQNILYNWETKQLKIIDFDISKEKFRSQEQFMMWTSTGSLHYKAPETFQFGYSQKIDVWSTGIILYELIAGQLPFVSAYEKQTINKIKSQKLDFSKLFCSKNTKLILAKMLQKEAKFRLSCEQCLQIISQQSKNYKDDQHLWNIRKSQNRLEYGSNKTIFVSHTEEKASACLLSCKVKMDFLSWNITIIQQPKE